MPGEDLLLKKILPGQIKDTAPFYPMIWAIPAATSPMACIARLVRLLSIRFSEPVELATA
jgi:hypothetical protein